MPFQSVIRKVNIWGLVFAIVTVLIVGCKSSKNDNPVPNNLNTTYTPGTGRLITRIFGRNGNGNSAVRDATVTLYMSNTDLQNDYFLYELLTNGSGEADFGFLNAGNYYLYVSKRLNDSLYSRIDVVQVQEAKDNIRNINLY